MLCFSQCCGRFCRRSYIRATATHRWRFAQPDAGRDREGEAFDRVVNAASIPFANSTWIAMVIPLSLWLDWQTRWGHRRAWLCCAGPQPPRCLMVQVAPCHQREPLLEHLACETAVSSSCEAEAMAGNVLR